MANKITVDGIVFDQPTRLQEKFFECFLEQRFENAQKAAKKAGCTSEGDALRVRANQLIKTPWVAHMIERVKNQQRERVIENTMLTREEVIHKMRKIYDQAMEDGKYDPAYKAVHALGTEIDMFTVKSEKTERRYNITADDPETKQKIARLQALLDGDLVEEEKTEVIEAEYTESNWEE